MIPLLFIMAVTGLSMKASTIFSEGTWLTYYLGGITGMLLSSVLLALWTRRRRRNEPVIRIKMEI